MAGLDTNAAKFVVGVSSATGIDPRVVVAWVVQEGTYTKGGIGHNNFLGLKVQAGDKYTSVGPGNFEQYANVNDAIYSASRRIKSNHAISATAKSKPSPREQIRAIAASSWDQNHYGPTGSPGKNLMATFGRIFGGNKGLDDTYVGPAQAGPIASTANTGSAADAGSYDAGNAAHDAASAAGSILGPFKSIAELIKWIGGNWDRMLLVFGGVILVVIALLYLLKSQQTKALGLGGGGQQKMTQAEAMANFKQADAAIGG